MPREGFSRKRLILAGRDGGWRLCRAWGRLFAAARLSRRHCIPGSTESRPTNLAPQTIRRPVS
jgi:hypothetical protein